MMNFLFVREHEIDEGRRIRIRLDRRFERLARAVALSPGTEFRVAAEGLGRGSGKVLELSASGMCASFESAAEKSAARCDLDLILAAPRPKVLRRLVPGIVSMGLRSITLVNASGVKREYFDTHWLEPGNLEELIMLGLEQGGVCRYPSVRIEKRLKPYLEDCVGPRLNDELRLLCLPGGSSRHAHAGGAGIIRIAVGPETGWTDFEEAMFAAAGFVPLSLGEEHMACDVACIAAVGAVKAGLV
jgi:RsmE family RNA methyltransferase